MTIEKGLQTPVETKRKLQVFETVSVLHLTGSVTAAALAVFFSILFTRQPAPQPQTLVNPICNPYNTYANGQWYEGTQHVHIEPESYLSLNGDITSEINALKTTRGLKWAMMGTYVHGIPQNGQYYPPGGTCPAGQNCNDGRTCPYGAGNCQTTAPSNNPTRDWIYDWNGDGVFHWEDPQTHRWYSYDEAENVPAAQRKSMQETIYLQWEKTAAEQGIPWLQADLKRADDDPNFIPINWVEAGSGTTHINTTAYDTRDVWRFDPAHYPGDPNFPLSYYNGAYRNSYWYGLVGTRAAPAPQYCRAYGENKWVYDRNGLAMLAHPGGDFLNPSDADGLCVKEQLPYTFGNAVVMFGGSLRVPNGPWAEEIWDRYLRAGYKHAWGWGEFDHCTEGPTRRCVGTDFVYTNTFTRQGLIDAMKKGSFYFSTGHPTSGGYTNILNVSVNQASQTISLRVRNANRVTWFGPGQSRNDPVNENDNPYIERDTGSVGSEWTASFTFNAATLAAIQQYAQQNNKPYTTPFIRAVVERSDAQQHSNLGPIAAFTQPFFYEPTGCTDAIEPPPPPCPEGQVNQGQVCTCNGRPEGNPAGFCCSGQWQTGPCVSPNQPPTVTLVAPESGQTIAGTFEVRAENIGDPDGTVTRVEFLLDGAEVIHTIDNPGSTVTWQWDTRGEENGTYLFSTRAVDDEGLSTTTLEVQIIIDNPNDILFGDNFEDGDANGWTNPYGFWSVGSEGGNSYYQTNSFPGAAESSVEDQAFFALPFEVSTRVKRVGTDVGVVALKGFVRTGSADNYNLTYDLSTNKLSLSNQDGLIQEATANLNVTNWHILTLRFSAINGVTGTIRPEGAQEPAATVRADSLYPYPAGTIAFLCNHGNVATNHCRFDDVVVRALPPEQTPPSGGTIFSDDFQDGNADGWSTDRGTWTVTNADESSYVYRGAPVNASDTDKRNAWVTGQSLTQDEFTIIGEGRVETASGDQVGLLANYTNANTHHRFFYSQAQQTLYLTRSGTPTATYSIPLSLNLTNWHFFKLTVRKSNNQLIFSGKIWPTNGTEPDSPQITWTDPNTPLTSGASGFTCRSTSTACRFDDFAVQTPGGTTPGGSPIFLKASPVFLKIDIPVVPMN